MPLRPWARVSGPGDPANRGSASGVVGSAHAMRPRHATSRRGGPICRPAMQTAISRSNARHAGSCVWIPSSYRARVADRRNFNVSSGACPSSIKVVARCRRSPSIHRSWNDEPAPAQHSPRAVHDQDCPQTGAYGWEFRSGLTGRAESHAWPSALRLNTPLLPCLHSADWPRPRRSQAKVRHLRQPAAAFAAATTAGK